MFNKLNLRAKILLTVVSCITIIALLFIAISYSIFSKTLKKGLLQKGITITNNLALRTTDMVLIEGNLTLGDMVFETLKNNDDIKYIFILNSNDNIIVHTFKDGFPEELLAATKIDTDEKNNIQLIETEDGEYIRDIAIPIYGGDLGIVHAGFSDELMHREIQKNLILTIEISIAVIIFGIIISYFLTGMFVKPLSEFLWATRRISKGKFDRRINITTNDEIGELADTFNKMIKDLKEYRDQKEEYSKTLEKKVEEKTMELRKKDALLIQTDKLASIGLLASGVAHELNNPLGSIFMNVNLVMETMDKDSAIYEDLQKIDEDTQRCKRIVDDLLCFSRQQELKLAYYNINEIINRTINFIRHEADNRMIDIETDLGPDIDDIYVDRNHLQQVLVNIMMNGIQAMDKAGKLTIITKNNDSENIIIVRDTGCGIPSKNMYKIYDPFFTTREEGTGLGLSICYGIMKRLNGSIEIESNFEKDHKGSSNRERGTVAILRLPVKGPVPDKRGEDEVYED